VSFTLSFFIEYTDWATAQVAILLIGGFWVIVWGSYRYNRAFSRPPGKLQPGQGQRWRQLLIWQIVDSASSDPAVLEEFSRSQDFIRSSALIGVGLVLLVVTIGSAAFALAATGTLVSLSAEEWLFFDSILLFGCLIGYSLGYVFGVWRLRLRTAGEVTYADLQQRTLADYRSPVFFWIALILSVWAMLLPLVLAPHLGPQVPLQIQGGRVIVEIPIWVVEAIPVIMLLTLFIGEVVLRRIARLPRLLLTSSPQTAQRADNLLRALTIGTLQGFELAMIGVLGYAQGNLIVDYFWQVGFWKLNSRPFSFLLDPESLFAIAVALLGFFLHKWIGRLGGRLSGWPWHPMRIP
jgi:hypothetical protein